MAEAWYGGGGDDLPEFPPLRQGKLRPGATVFNLGAHHGVVALRLAAEVAPGGIVVAVEANPVSAAAAQRNAALNSDFPIIVENVAVGATSGTIQVSSDWGSQSVGAGEHRIPLVTIDELAARHGSPDVVYIDIEGWEQAALEGARDTLGRGPDWCVEVHAGCGLEEAGGSVSGILKCFSAYGYETQALIESDSGVVSWVEAPEETDACRKRFHLLAAKRPTNDGALPPRPTSSRA
jgi:FkbM family methyltransferase